MISVFIYNEVSNVVLSQLFLMISKWIILRQLLMVNCGTVLLMQNLVSVIVVTVLSFFGLITTEPLTWKLIKVWLPVNVIFVGMLVTSMFRYGVLSLSLSIYIYIALSKLIIFKIS